MDVVFFSVNSLDDAKTITHEAIELFDSHGFKLVKWSANRVSIPILADLNKEILVPNKRELDLSLDNGNDLPDAKALGCVWETGEDR